MRLRRALLVALIAPVVLLGGARPIAARAQSAQSALHDQPIRMSDGVELVADVDLPPGAGPFPVILHVTPYGRLTYTTAYIGHGFAHVNVDVRGTGRSGGVNCVTCPREQDDVVEVIAWAARQPWSTGKVGMVGGSYSAFLQLLAAAKQPPALKAIVPRAAWSDPYRDGWYQNGLFNQSVVAAFSAFQPVAGMTGTSASPAMLGPLLARPENPTPLQAALAHPFDDGFYRERAIYTKYSDITVPALFVGGWFDMFTAGTVRNFNGVASRYKRLIMGPWTHHRAGGLGETFPEPYPDVQLPDPDPILAWFQHFLAGADNGVERGPRVQSFDLGTARWTTQDQWPPPRSSLVDLRLSGAPSRSIDSLHDGSLIRGSRVTSAGSAPDSYAYDPTVGVAETTGRQNAVFLTPYERVDQRADDRRSVTYTTAGVSSPLRLDGPMELALWVSTSASDSDVVAKVSDVGPDGTSLLLSTGYVRLSHRRVDARRSRPGEPWLRNDAADPVPVDAPISIRVPLDPIDATLAAGHRLRLSVASADIAVHQPLPEPAIVTLLHDVDHPSVLRVTLAGGADTGSVVK